MDRVEMWRAMNALGRRVSVSLASGNIFVATFDGMVEIGNGSTLSSCAGRSADEPLEAIERLFDELTKLKEGQRVVIDAMTADKRREVRWNGFMWEDFKP